MADLPQVHERDLVGWIAVLICAAVWAPAWVVLVAGALLLGGLLLWLIQHWND